MNVNTIVNRFRSLFAEDSPLLLGGTFDISLRQHHIVLKAIQDKDPEKESWARSFVQQMGHHRTKYGYEDVLAFSADNLITTTGLEFVLNLIFDTTTSKVATWYAPVFTSDSVPAVGWTSDAFKVSGGMAAELPDASYDEAGRRPLVFAAKASGAAIASNVAIYTIAAGVAGVNAYGVGVTNVNTVAYANTDRVLLAATRFDASGGSSKLGLSTTDELGVRYTLRAANVA